MEEEIISTEQDPQEVIVEVDKHEKFKEQSVNLVRKAMVAIENLQKVSNAKNFEYSEEEVDVMFNALQETMDHTKEMFRKKKEFSWD